MGRQARRERPETRLSCYREPIRRPTSSLMRYSQHPPSSSATREERSHSRSNLEAPASGLLAGQFKKKGRKEKHLSIHELLQKNRHSPQPAREGNPVRASADHQLSLGGQFELAVRLFQEGSNEVAYELFRGLLARAEGHPPELLFYTAVLAKRLGEFEAALGYIQTHLGRHPKDPDARAFRGKLLLKLGRPESALKELTELQRAHKSHLGVLLNLADCLKACRQYEQAEKHYERACQLLPRAYTLIKKGVNLFLGGKSEKAMAEFEQAIALDPGDHEAHLMKGLALAKLRRVCEAQLVFEHIITEMPLTRSAPKALEECLRTLIEDRDYYGAYHKLTRSPLRDARLERLALFLEGTTCLMKSNHLEGIRALTRLVNSGHYSSYVRPLLYAHRAYGYFCLKRYRQALNDLKLLEAAGPLSSTNLYNRHLLEGITCCQDRLYEGAVLAFRAAGQLRPSLPEPLLYCPALTRGHRRSRHPALQPRPRGQCPRPAPAPPGRAARQAQPRCPPNPRHHALQRRQPQGIF
jgi:tetratricopeptide (TPR) repeat protein